MIRVAVVEDEDIYVDQMKDYLKRYEQESGKRIQIHVFRDGEDLLEDYTGEFDIILLDIQMRFLDGMSAAEKIRELDKKVILIFVTNMVQYAVKGYSVDAMDYILKPVDYFMFSQRLNKAVEKIQKASEYFISLRCEEGICKVALSDLLYVESQKHQLCYVTSKREYTVRGRISDCEESLKAHGFFRIHKGYLVNMRMVDRIDGENCFVFGNMLPISRAQKKEFMKEMMNYIGEN